MPSKQHKQIGPTRIVLKLASIAFLKSRISIYIELLHWTVSKANCTRSKLRTTVQVNRISSSGVETDTLTSRQALEKHRLGRL